MGNTEFENRVALVTGSARGLGRAIAEKMQALGAIVVLSDINEQTLNSAVADMSANGEVFGIAMDVSRIESVEEAIAAVIEKYGRIDILVNNAGITKDGLMMRMSESDFDAVIAVNLKGVFNVSQCVSKTMLKKRSGNIINISSVVGITGNVGQANYSASKAGVIGLTKTCAKEFGKRGIRVNAIAPGFIKSDMTDVLSDSAKDELKKNITLGRLGQPEDIANTAAFLASDNASYITGQVIVVDGGMIT